MTTNLMSGMGGDAQFGYAFGESALSDFTAADNWMTPHRPVSGTLSGLVGGTGWCEADKAFRRGETIDRDRSGPGHVEAAIVESSMVPYGARSTEYTHQDPLTGSSRGVCGPCSTGEGKSGVSGEFSLILPADPSERKGSKAVHKDQLSPEPARTQTRDSDHSSRGSFGPLVPALRGVYRARSLNYAGRMVFASPESRPYLPNSEGHPMRPLSPVSRPFFEAGT